MPRPAFAGEKNGVQFEHETVGEFVGTPRLEGVLGVTTRLEADPAFSEA